MEILVRAIYLVLMAGTAACSDRTRVAGGQSASVVPGDSVSPSSADSPEKQIVLRARAFDRADNLDSARILYEEAARRVPLVKDWLTLRAAGVTRDRGDRERMLSRVDLPVAQERRKPTEAIALERSGDVAGAIDAYSAIGERLAAIRLRMLAPADSQKMTIARRDLVALLAAPPSAQQAREAIVLFDKSFPNPTPVEQLTIARAAYAAGNAQRAASGYARAVAGGLGTSRDRFDNGLILARLNRDREAAAEFARVTSPEPLAAAARYQRARAMLAMGHREEARSALREITTAYPQDTSAASALLLLSDLATDDMRDADARVTLQSIARRFPRSRHASVALFRAGLIAYIAHDYRTAANELDS
ncbi:MAG TPA: tetratricopeptide repeat protein, partial [Gemmatimonadaceae bacterium]|nr:tetratricopeptide repeat protein [Gemmatimonadaceae bacterium]